MTSRERFLAACRCEKTDRVPAWIMRQAGRYLPEYRALKEKHDFLTLVRTPELAAEVTLQPVRRFPLLDAAITFSDILVIPEALGQKYFFRETGGIEMEFTLDSPEQIEKLGDANSVPEKLAYVAAAQKIVRMELGASRALLGFAGTPWTLATYMVEGGSAKQFSKIKELAYEHPQDFCALMEKLSKALIAYLQMQISAGVDAVQLFDSWAGLCTTQEYENLSLRWIKKIIEQLPANIPVIVFAKGMAHLAPQIAKTGAHVLGVDWTQQLSEIRKLAGTNLALQGNLDPAVLNFSNPAIVRKRTREILNEMRGQNGFIFNLGHGIMPQAKIENVSAMLDEIAYNGEATSPSLSNADKIIPASPKINAQKSDEDVASPLPKFFNPLQYTNRSLANLPHWEQGETTCFATFRLADSLPQKTLSLLKKERDTWVSLHPTPWDKKTEREYFELFEARVNKWLDDGNGSCIFHDPKAREIVETALLHSTGKQYKLHAFVVMPNHVHVLFSPLGENTIPQILKNWKSFTAHTLNRTFDTKGAVWQKESWDKLIRNKKHFDRVIAYIIENNPKIAYNGEATSPSLSNADKIIPASPKSDGDVASPI